MIKHWDKPYECFLVSTRELSQKFNGDCFELIDNRASQTYRTDMANFQTHLTYTPCYIHVKDILWVLSKYKQVGQSPFVMGSLA